MAPTVFAAVLLGAALHATWNAIVKGGSDKLMTTVLVVAASGLVALVALPFLPCPRPRAGRFSSPRRRCSSSTSPSSPAPTPPPT